VRLECPAEVTVRPPSGVLAVTVFNDGRDEVAVTVSVVEGAGRVSGSAAASASVRPGSSAQLPFTLLYAVSDYSVTLAAAALGREVGRCTVRVRTQCPAGTACVPAGQCAGAARARGCGGRDDYVCCEPGPCPEGTTCTGVTECKMAGGTCAAPCLAGCCCRFPPRKSVKAKICATAIFPRYVVACVDKKWGDPGCQPWTGDWRDILAVGCTETPLFSASRVLTVVTSAYVDDCFSVVVYDGRGNELKRCPCVHRNSPCVYEV
jgi:hypothetical protein